VEPGSRPFARTRSLSPVGLDADPSATRAPPLDHPTSVPSERNALHAVGDPARRTRHRLGLRCVRRIQGGIRLRETENSGCRDRTTVQSAFPFDHISSMRHASGHLFRAHGRWALGFMTHPSGCEAEQSHATGSAGRSLRGTRSPRETLSHCHEKFRGTSCCRHDALEPHLRGDELRAWLGDGSVHSAERPLRRGSAPVIRRAGTGSRERAQTTPR